MTGNIDFIGVVFSAHAEVVPFFGNFGEEGKSILRARGGSSWPPYRG